MLPKRFQVENYHQPEEGDPNRLYFHISLDEGRHGAQFGEIRIRVCWLRMRTKGEGQDVESYQTIEYHGDYVHNNETHLNWFQITAQYNCFATDLSDNVREPYAIRIGYREESMNVLEIEKLEARVKFLRWLHAKIEKYEEKYGRITSFSRYVAVVFAEMGIEGMVCDHPDYPGTFNKRVYHLYRDDVEKMVDGAVKHGSVLDWSKTEV